LRREKTNIIQATCISAEAVHDLKSMLRERGSPKEGALFVSQKGQRLTTRFINEAIRKLAQKAYPDKKFKTKSLRSSYNSALLRANIQPQELKDLLMGHKRAGARSHYAYDKITIKEAYEKVFQYLSINNGKQARKDLEQIQNTIVGLSQTIVKQQEEIVKLRTILEQHNVQFQKMTAEFDERLTWLENKHKKTEKVKLH